MTKKSPTEIIEQLSPAVAWEVLRILARRDAVIADQIAEVALAHLGDVDLEEIAGTLYEDLSLLDVEEVWAQAGPTRYGYVEPGEVASEMMGKVLDPYLEDLRKYFRLDMRAEATQFCMGLLLGCYRFEHAAETEFKDWAPDAMYVSAECVLDVWNEGHPSQVARETIRTFMQQRLNGWGPRVA
jgi:hypothetical protein